MVQAGYDYSRHWEEPSINKQPQVRRVKKTYKVVNLKRKILFKFGILAFVYALILVYLCIKSATLGYQIVALEKELEQYEAANARLQYAIQEACSLERVEQIAMNQLGMYKPEKHLVIAYSDPLFTIQDDDTNTNDNNDDNNSVIAESEEKPLYKLYTNLLLLAEKN
ncbi:MAG: hypothetical protein GX790_08970 [Syntrophomonadaceae bacterium]|nr:hypothetical protein [Syntrophomonadaceae bacterium]